MAGLRGSASLIMAQAVVTEVSMMQGPPVSCWRAAARQCLPPQQRLHTSCSLLPDLTPSTPSSPWFKSTHVIPLFRGAHFASLQETQVVKSQVVFWTAGFVLLTLLINAPLLPWVLRVTRLSVIPPKQLARRRRAVEALAEHTAGIIGELRSEEDGMLAGGCSQAGKGVCLAPPRSHGQHGPWTPPSGPLSLVLRHAGQRLTNVSCPPQPTPTPCTPGVDWAHVERYCDFGAKLAPIIGIAPRKKPGFKDGVKSLFIACLAACGSCCAPEGSQAQGGGKQQPAGGSSQMAG